MERTTWDNMNIYTCKPLSVPFSSAVFFISYVALSGCICRLIDLVQFYIHIDLTLKK